MLKVKIPNICQTEQRYILGVLLGDFLGLNFEVFIHASEDIEITRSAASDNSKKLTINASFFNKAGQGWLSSESMPFLPLEKWIPMNDGLKVNLVELSSPVLYGQPGLERENQHLHLNLDLFGSAFFMLSRYEELVGSDRDSHDRFPASASVAYKANFIDRPIVNEYLEILWACLNELWPDLTRKKRQYRKLISCDVDHPFDLAGYSMKRTILRIGARLLRDKNPKLAINDLLNYIYKKFDSDQFDEYRKNIDWMMHVNSSAGNTVTFNFIPIQTDTNKDDPYDIRSEKISNLLKHIENSGHKIGIHPGYNTYKFPDAFNNSVNALKEACENKSIDVSQLGGRQHYLRYDAEQTPKLWEANDLSYDSTLGYADKAGFRCGICYEFPMYDLLKRQKMKLRQRPLVVMENTVISKTYEGLGYSEKTYERIKNMARICKQFEGDFTLLWHNSFFMKSSLKSIYKGIISKEQSGD